jgi:hypothetical protein
VVLLVLKVLLLLREVRHQLKVVVKLLLRQLQKHKPLLKLLLLKVVLKVVENLNSKIYYKKENLSNLRGFFMLPFLDM